MNKTLKEKLNLGKKVYKMKLKILSPTFVGGGDYNLIPKNEYIFDKKRKKIYVLNPRKWVKFLIRTNLIIEYSNQSNINCNIHKFLEERKIREDLWKQGKHIKYEVHAPDMHKPYDLHTFIKDVDGNPYIPGSSIKGALRTAIMFQLLLERKKEDKFKLLWEELKQALKLPTIEKINDKIDEIEKTIEKKLLQKITFKKERKEINDSLRDIFRAISVSDTLPVEVSSLVVLKKIDATDKKRSPVPDLKHLHKDFIGEIPLYREYLKPGTELSFLLSVDKRMFSRTTYPLFDKNIITGCLEIFSKWQLNAQKLIIDRHNKHEEFKKVIDPSSYSKRNLLLGGGSGFLSKTTIYAIAPNHNEAKAFIANYLDKAFTNPSHKHKKNDQAISPRTLKLARYEDNLHNIGWCSLEVVDELC